MKPPTKKPERYGRSTPFTICVHETTEFEEAPYLVTVGCHNEVRESVYTKNPTGDTVTGIIDRWLRRAADQATRSADAVQAAGLQPEEANTDGDD